MTLIKHWKAFIFSAKLFRRGDWTHSSRIKAWAGAAVVNLYDMISFQSIITF